MSNSIGGKPLSQHIGLYLKLFGIQESPYFKCGLFYSRLKRNVCGVTAGAEKSEFGGGQICVKYVKQFFDYRKAYKKYALERDLK